MTSCAITDHGSLFKMIEFYKELNKRGLNPIIGVEAYLTNDQDGIENNKHKSKDNYHCIMLAQNDVGLANIIWLVNQANLHNFYYKPRISIENLKTRGTEGIIATSSCLGGVIAKQGSYDSGNKTFVDDSKKCQNTLGLFKELFPDRFYAEIQDNDTIWEQGAYNDWLIREAKQQRVPTVITSDAHFLKKEDKELHDLVMAQQLKITVQEYACDEDGMAYSSGHYVRSPTNMLSAALQYGEEDAFYNTVEIAKKCKVNIALGKYENPEFDFTNESDYQDFLKWKKETAANGVNNE